MSLLTVVKDVCLAVGVNPPTSMFAASIQPRTQAEMLSLANEMAQRISADAREWGALKFVNTYTGDGTTTAWGLPANYRRLLLTSNVWRGNTPLSFIPDTDEWVQRRINPASSNTSGEWTIYGGQMHIFPPLGGLIPASPPDPEVPAETATFVYLSRNCVSLFSGGFGDTFMNDLDRFALDERLLKLGMIAQWKMNKGSPYAEDMGTYQDALVMAMGSDRPAPILVAARPRPPMGVSYANIGW